MSQSRIFKKPEIRCLHVANYRDSIAMKHKLTQHYHVVTR